MIPRALIVSVMAATSVAAITGIRAIPNLIGRPAATPPYLPPPASVAPPAAAEGHATPDDARQNPKPGSILPEAASLSAPPPAPEQGRVRDVTPRGVTPAPTVTGPLQRIVPEPTPPNPAKPEKPRVLRPILVVDGRTLKAGDIVVTLKDMEPPGASETCPEADGRTWACGAAATAALRAFVRGRGVQCMVPKDAREGTFATHCSIGPTDLTEWMIRRGWAKAITANGPHAAAETQARKENLGLWRMPAPIVAEGGR